MSLSIAGIGAVQPVYAPSGPIASYAQNQTVAESVSGTTAGAEAGAVAVVYEPSASDADQQLTYSNREPGRAAELAAAAASAKSASGTGDDAVVAATGGTALPPPALPDTPLSAQVKEVMNNVWAPVGPIMADPGAGAPAVATPQVGQAEAHAQATYAAVVDAMIAGASTSEVEKFA